MIKELFDLVDQVATENITDYAGKLTHEITPILGAAITLYFLYKAYEIIWTDKSLAGETVITFAAFLAVFSIAVGGEYYYDNIVPFVLHAGEDLSNALVGSHGGADSLDKMYQDIYSWADLIWQNASGFSDSLQAGIMWLVLMVTGCLFVAIATLYLLVAKIMVSILLVLGTLFISFAFFPSTRSFFQAWTGQCVNYILLMLCFTITFGMFQKISGILIDANTLNYMIIGENAVLFIIMTFVAIQVPALCSSLSGGVGINGLVGQVGGFAMGAIGGAAAGVVGGAKAASFAKTDLAKDINSIRKKFSNNLEKG